MSPDSIDTRVGRLEQTVSRMDQQVQDVVTVTRQLMPLAVTVGRVEVVVDGLKDDMQDVLKRMDTDAQERRQGQAERAKEDRGRKLTLVVAFLAAGAALLSAVVGAVAVLIQ